MKATYEITYEVSLPLLKRAMVSWAKPKGSGFRRNGLLVLGGAALGLVIAVSGIIDRLSNQLLLGLVIGFFAGLAFWLIMHQRDIKRLSDFTMDQLVKQGPTTAKFGPDGVEMTNRLITAKATWVAYDQVIKMTDATVLRTGAMAHPIPYRALPAGLDPEAFHADLVRWQAEANP